LRHRELPRLATRAKPKCYTNPLKTTSARGWKTPRTQGKEEREQVATLKRRPEGSHYTHDDKPETPRDIGKARENSGRQHHKKNPKTLHNRKGEESTREKASKERQRTRTKNGDTQARPEETDRPRRRTETNHQSETRRKQRRTKKRDEKNKPNRHKENKGAKEWKSTKQSTQRLAERKPKRPI